MTTYILRFQRRVGPSHLMCNLPFVQFKYQLYLPFNYQVGMRICTKSMGENIHKTLAAIITSLFHNPPTVHVIAAPECGGTHRIQLFSNGLKSRSTNYCCPDVAITLNGELSVILEIEQTGIVSPGRIGGKVLPVSMSRNLCSEAMGSNPVSISRNTTFIQVVNTAPLQPTTSKLRQYENLEADIRKTLPLRCIVRYFLIPIVAEESPPFATTKYDFLLEAIREGFA